MDDRQEVLVSATKAQADLLRSLSLDQIEKMAKTKHTGPGHQLVSDAGFSLGAAELRLLAALPNLGTFTLGFGLGLGLEPDPDR